MEIKYVKVTFTDNEFAEKFPEISNRKDLNESDKVRLALGLEPRKAKPGAPKDNKNAVGNKGRWASELK